METFASHPENPDSEEAFLNNGRETQASFTEENSAENQPTFENPERLTGTPYFNYLRAHDDML
ncbi:MAG: hypothetical protein EOO48_01015 [Flavobacterium sp.]|nr:MAG: hypothetical protein EOO48_01015 [Flavobacterium sp.]